jgi:hypothetical protein
MIIGFSGKIGSGKDLGGMYMQHIASESRYYSLTDWENENDSNREEISGWEIKKFGGKLKDIVCILLGCTRADLEDREFKNKLLGPRWVKYVLRYSDKYSVDGYVRTFLSQEAAEEYLEEQNAVYFSDIKRVELTPRLLLQLLGTECGREIIHPNIWVNATMADYISYSARGSDYEFEESNWIITDVRFPNEVRAIEESGGIVIRIERPGLESSDHESETALDDWDFKYKITNDDTKKHLYRKLEEIYTKENDKVENNI